MSDAEFGNSNGMHSVKIFDDCQIIVGRKSGYIDFLSLEDGSLHHRQRVFDQALDAFGKPILNKHKKPKHFIGVAAVNRYVLDL